MQSMVFQWFSVLLPSLSMVFDGFGPLVKRCDGFDESLWSNRDFQTWVYNKKKYYFQMTSTMLEEANDETLALIKKLNYMKCDEEFKAILSSVSPKVVRRNNVFLKK